MNQKPTPAIPSGSPLVELAFQIARDAHKGQTRPNGEPYINHPIRVAERLEGNEAKAGGLLHDVIEDTTLGADDLRAAGIPEDVITDVVTLSRQKGETYFDFILRVNETGRQRVMEVKVADLEDNLADFDPSTARPLDIQRADKYRLARWMLQSTVASLTL